MIPRICLAAALALALAAAGPAPALAQYDEDERTRDQEDVDRSYLERYRQPEEDAPEEDTEDQLASFLARAERLIRDRNYHSAHNERYRVQTDDPRLDARAAVDLLDAFRDYFDRFWRERIDLAPYDAESRVFLFYSFHKFNEALEGDFRYRTYRPTGHYGALFDVITLHTDPDGPGSLEEALIHEAAHQLTDQRLYAGGQTPSRWVSEGLAQYFGYTRTDESGSFRRGEIGGKSTRLLRGVKSSEAELRGKLRSARATLKKAGAEAGAIVDRVVSIRDPNEFYGERAPLNYGVSWLLVHFLLEGEQGAHVDGFLRYLELERQGRGGRDTFYGELGLAPDELGTALLAHLNGINVR